jgi:hypothetical protein
VDVEVTDVYEGVLGFSYNVGTDPEDLNFTFPTGGTYYIKVYPYDDAQSPYTLTLDLVAGQPNDLPAGAALLPLNTDVGGSVGGVDGTDWWRLDVVASGPVTVALTNLFDDIDLEVYDAATALGDPVYGLPIAASYNILDFDELVTIAATPGTYYVRVVPWGGAQSPYTLRAGDGGPELRVDAFDFTNMLFGDRIEITVTNLRVVNDGTATSPEFEVAAGLSDTNDPGDVYWFNPDGVRWSSPAIPPGGSTTWDTGTETLYKSGISPSGDYYVMVVADFAWGEFGGAIYELNELDNYFYSATEFVSIP